MTFLEADLKQYCKFWQLPSRYEYVRWARWKSSNVYGFLEVFVQKSRVWFHDSFTSFHWDQSSAMTAGSLSAEAPINKTPNICFYPPWALRRWPNMGSLAIFSPKMWCMCWKHNIIIHITSFHYPSRQTSRTFCRHIRDHLEWNARVKHTPQSMMFD